MGRFLSDKRRSELYTAAANASAARRALERVEKLKKKTVETAESYLKRREYEKERQANIKAQKAPLWAEVAKSRYLIRIYQDWLRKMRKRLATEELEPQVFLWLTKGTESLESKIELEKAKVEEFRRKIKEIK